MPWFFTSRSQLFWCIFRQKDKMNFSFFWVKKERENNGEVDGCVGVTFAMVCNRPTGWQTNTGPKSSTVQDGRQASKNFSPDRIINIFQSVLVTHKCSREIFRSSAGMLLYTHKCINGQIDQITRRAFVRMHRYLSQFTRIGVALPLP